ncbi:MAG: M50 family metallopeptidase, partial [Planctomycetes bacterium]|nr:M50 family metallopeptidase [Planctomycetota bacterium]
MFKTWLLGRVFGVELKAHGTLIGLLAIGAVFSLLSGGLGGLLSAALVVGALILSVTLHELGHIAAASFYGNSTRGITLTPIGGIAQLENEAQSPQEEVVVAIAGPAVSFALAGLAALPLALFGPSSLAVLFLQVNLMLGVFNLLPAYPMDGGRILRGVLWSWQGYFKATWNAARAGQAFAVLLGLAGLFLSGSLVIVAIFIGLQATFEIARLRLLRAQALQQGLGDLAEGDAQAVASAIRTREGWVAAASDAVSPRPRAPEPRDARMPGRFTRISWVEGPNGRT